MFFYNSEEAQTAIGMHANLIINNYSSRSREWNSFIIAVFVALICAVHLEFVDLLG